MIAFINPCKKCGDVLTEQDKGNGEKFMGCYRCQEPEAKCTCKPRYETKA